MRYAHRHFDMLRFVRIGLVVVSACLLALAATTRPSAAQTTTTTTTTATTATTGPVVAQSSGQINPNRIVNGKNLGQSTRSINLTPLGISYADCASDMTLDFPLIFSGFDGGEPVQVWAGTSDCSNETARGFSALAVCWPVAQPIAGIVASTATPLSKTISVRVQDIVSQAALATKVTTYVKAGLSACSTQSVDTAQAIGLYFVPTYPNGTDFPGSVTYPYNLTVDLLGPIAPTISSITTGAGDTLLVPKWVPNVDPDTIGYDIYIDPFPGREGSAVTGSEPVLVCREAGASSSSGGTSTVDAGDAGDALAATDASGADDADDASADDASPLDATSSSDAEVSSSEDASLCTLEFPPNSVGTGTGGTCASSVLSGGNTVIVDSGVATTTTLDDAADDADLLDDADTDAATAVASGGGISNVSSAYLYQPNSSTGITVASITASQFNVTGLINGLQYNIAIAGVDALGNVGPLSTLQCGTPQPVDDFWKKYREAGGQAGGGFCALEAAGAPAGSAALFGGMASVVVAAWRRRRRKSR
jgi:hypothetical protein